MPQTRQMAKLSTGGPASRKNLRVSPAAEAAPRAEEADVIMRRTSPIGDVHVSLTVLL